MHKQRISCSLNAISRTNNVKYLCTISTEAGKYGVQEKLASETTGRKSYVGFLASLLDNDVNRYCNTWLVYRAAAEIWKKVKLITD